jgi:hypothetical protein
LRGKEGKMKKKENVLINTAFYLPPVGSGVGAGVGTGGRVGVAVVGTESK